MNTLTIVAHTDEPATEVRALPGRGSIGDQNAAPAATAAALCCILMMYLVVAFRSASLSSAV